MLKKNSSVAGNLIAFIGIILLLGSCAPVTPTANPEPTVESGDQSLTAIVPTPETSERSTEAEASPAEAVEAPSEVNEDPPEATESPVVWEETQPVPGGPVLLRNDITLRKVLDVGAANIRLAKNPLDGDLYYLHPFGGVIRVNIAGSANAEEVVSLEDLPIDGLPAGMTFGADGTLYIVMNRSASEVLTQAVILRGVADEDGEYRWEILAESEPYAASGTNFDHLFTGIEISPDDQWAYVSSGSRTDHGEVEDNGGSFPGMREIDLTSRIFRIATESSDLIIPSDESAQLEQDLLFANGTRNAYDLAFAPNGDLFAIDNGPDADLPDELNWVRQGAHYGFPWRFGNQDNPQQFAAYDPASDKLLSGDFVAVQRGTYENDPDFPPAPGPFAEPVANLGPAAAQYRGEDGEQYDAAAEGEILHTFTPHRSPLGLVFATDPNMPADLLGSEETLSAFVLSWGSAGGTLSDRGQDLLHLALTKQGENYQAVTTQIARDFKNPIDAVMIGNSLYVLEYGADGAIWELTFEQ